MKWFKHYSDASTSIKINSIIDKFGLEGYARWFLLLELLATKFDGETPYFEIHFSEISAKLRIKFSKKLTTFMQELSNFHLIKLQIDSKVYKIECPMLLDLKSRDFKKARQDRGSTVPKIKDIDIDIDIEKKETKKNVSVKNSSPNLFHEIIKLWNDTHGAKLNKRYAMPSGTDMQNYKITQGYLPDLESWRDLFEKCEGTKLMGTDENFKCSWFGLGWLFKNENAANVINGQWEKIKTKNDGGNKNYTDAEIDKILTGK